MTPRQLFERWLYHIKGYSAKKVKELCAVYDSVNNYLNEKTKGENDLFSVDSVKQYNQICQKWLTAKFLGMHIDGRSVTLFAENKRLYQEFVSSQYFGDSTLPEIEEPVPLVEKEVFQEEISSIEDEIFPEQAPVSEELVVVEKTETLEAEPLRKQESDITQLYIDEIVNTALKVVGGIVSCSRKPSANPERRNVRAYYDLVNETAFIDGGESYNRVLDLDSYAFVDEGKPLKRHNSAIENYVSDATAYGTICGLDERGIVNEVIEKAIADATSGYRIDESRTFCLIPDVLDDFHREIRRQINYRGKRLFIVPKSVSLLMAELADGVLVEGKTYYVIDFDGNEVSVTCLETQWNEDFEEPTIIRRGLCRLNGEYPGYTEISKKYLIEYRKKHGANLDDELIERLSQTKFLCRHFRDKKEELIANGACYIQLIFDEEIYCKLEREVKENENRIIKELHIENEEIYSICSLLFSHTGYNDLFEGCKEIGWRLDNGQPLWKEYLPHLSLEVESDGGFNEIELIKRNEYRDVLEVLNESVTIHIDKGEITLTAGEPFYKLPLERDVVGNQNSDKMARLESKHFPLKEDLRVKLEIHYCYGDEDSYRLHFIPLSPAPFEGLVSEWCDVEPIGHITPPEFKIVDDNEYTEIIDNIAIALPSIALNFCLLHEGDKIPNNKRQFGRDVKGRTESKLFWRLNNYRLRRKFFSPTALQSSKVRSSIKELYDYFFFSYMIELLKKESVWRRQLDLPDEFNVVYANATRILSDICAIYMAIPQNTGLFDQIEEIVHLLFTENKLGLLAPLSRYVGKEDRYGIFDRLAGKIKEKFDKNKFEDDDLRTLSANCWYSEKWIENLIDAKYGIEVVELLTERCIEYLKNFDFAKYVENGNPRFVRDVMELFLCLTRADPFYEKKCGTKLIDPDSKQIKELVKIIKFIDNQMSACSKELKYPFVSRLNIGANQYDLTNVNEISYMLIKTLQGGGNFALIRFEED